MNIRVDSVPPNLSVRAFVFLLAAVAFIVGAFAMYTLISAAGFPAVVIPEKLVRLAANLSALVGSAAMVVALRVIHEAEGR